MTDVTRAVLLPDLAPASDLTLLTLALYWDELIVPEYRERYFRTEDQASSRSRVADELTEAGVLRPTERQADLERVVPVDFRRDPETNGVVLRLSDAMVDQLRRERVPALDEFGRGRDVALPLALTHEEARDIIASHIAEHLLVRLEDATTLAEREHLAPVACSRLCHLASLLGAPAEDLPTQEAALLSVAAASFRPDPTTSVEQVLRFREETRASRARFRAAVGDLGEELKVGGSTKALLARARDRYRNHIVPALAELEDVLKENKILFVIRSLVRASAITLAPMKPAQAAGSGAQIVAETLTYSFSKNKLVRDHPYGYLHEINRLDGSPAEPFTGLLAEDNDGDAAVRRLILTEGLPAVVAHFFGDLTAHTKSLPRGTKDVP